LPTGYPPKYRHLVAQAFQLLKAENPSALHVASHRTGRGTSPHVCLVPTRHWPRGVRGLMNGYRKSVGRQPYGKDLKTLLPLRRR
jgi:hypothetical protein